MGGADGAGDRGEREREREREREKKKKREREREREKKREREREIEREREEWLEQRDGETRRKAGRQEGKALGGRKWRKEGRRVGRDGKEKGRRERSQKGRMDARKGRKEGDHEGRNPMAMRRGKIDGFLGEEVRLACQLVDWSSLIRGQVPLPLVALAERGFQS